MNGINIKGEKLSGILILSVPSVQDEPPFLPEDQYRKTIFDEYNILTVVIKDIVMMDRTKVQAPRGYIVVTGVNNGMKYFKVGLRGYCGVNNYREALQDFFPGKAEVGTQQGWG